MNGLSQMQFPSEEEAALAQLAREAAAQRLRGRGAQGPAGPEAITPDMLNEREDLRNALIGALIGGGIGSASFMPSVAVGGAAMGGYHGFNHRRTQRADDITRAQY